MLISINNASITVFGIYLINFQTITDWHQYSLLQMLHVNLPM